MGADRPLLELREVHAGYPETPVLRGVSFSLDGGEVVAVIGANGAGKSTLLRTIFGMVMVAAGELLLDGEAIARLSSRERLRRGIVLVPQGRCNFPLMSVEENLELGAYTRTDGRRRSDIERVMERFPILADKRHQLAGNLSGGEQQLLEMGMSLMLSPRLVLIDEPSLGLSPAMQAIVFDAILSLRELGAGVLLVEQNAVQALRAADRGIVIELGKVGMEGTGIQMLEDPEVRRAYLGLEVGAKGRQRA